jgi:filamentous hemagglutinin family protein
MSPAVQGKVMKLDNTSPGGQHGFRARVGPPRPTLLALTAALCLTPVSALAQANGATVIHGQASFSSYGNQLVITTHNGAGTRHSAIDWQQFSVPQGGSTRFNQPDAASTSINRVLGSDPSRILGTLSSNGRLVLVNPAGITVGQGAAVDTAGFTASTLRMSDADALAGRLRFEGGVPGAALTVDGRVTAQVGDVVLIGSNVAVGSGGFAYAPDGAVVLAAGQKVELTGRGLEGIRMEVTAPTDSALNLGTLQADAVGMFAANLKHSGLIRADGAAIDGNKLRLVATKSSTIDGMTRKGSALVLKQEDDKAAADKAAKDQAEKDKAEQEKAAKAKTEKEKADKQKNAGNHGEGENGGAGNGDQASSGPDDSAATPVAASPPGTSISADTPSPAPPAPTTATATAPTDSPAPAPAVSPSPAAGSSSATAPATSDPVSTAPAAAATPAPAPAAAATPATEEQHFAVAVQAQQVVDAAKAQENQVISFLAAPVTNAVAETSPDPKKRKADRDALQCTP